MTDQADTGPIREWLAVIERYYGTDSLAASVYQRATLHTVARDLAEGVGVGNAAAAKLATLLAESADEVRALRAENANLADEITDLTEHTYPRTWGGFKAFIDEQYPHDVFGIGDGNTDGPAMVRAAHALADAVLERDALAAELAAARDQIAAVTNERNRLIAAALSQSGQPTKGEPA